MSKLQRGPSGHPGLRPLPRHITRPCRLLPAAVLVLCGCAVQPAYTPHTDAVADPPSWSATTGQADPDARPLPERWWAELNDPAIDTLVDAALADSPTLAQVVSRVDEARATLDVNAAQSKPAITASAGVTRSRQQSNSSASPEATVLTTVASAGPSLNWELDLFGRVRQATEAARSRVDARTQDAANTRLSLVADIANGVLSLRACESTVQAMTEEIASRETTLALTRRRLGAGFAAKADEARALTGLASTRTSLATQQEQCVRQTHALVALSGKDAATVRSLVAAIPTGPDKPADGTTASAATTFMPVAPGAVTRLPAQVLARHPAIVSADREAQAAWADVGVAKANRLPRLDLAAVLTGQWLSAAGVSQHLLTWSIGPSLSATLFDGGAGAANVSAAEARYRGALATFASTLRTTVQDVENALAAQASADARRRSAEEGLSAARTLLTTSEAQWRAGATSLLDLEDSRRQFATSRDAVVTARRDQVQSWISLVKATGGAVTLSAREPLHD